MPSLDGPYAYYSRYAVGNEHPIVARIDRTDINAWTPDGAAPASYKEILDANILAEGKEFFKLGGVEQVVCVRERVRVCVFVCVGVLVSVCVYVNSGRRCKKDIQIGRCGAGSACACMFVS